MAVFRVNRGSPSGGHATDKLPGTTARTSHAGGARTATMTTTQASRARLRDRGPPRTVRAAHSCADLHRAQIIRLYGAIGCKPRSRPGAWGSTTTEFLSGARPYERGARWGKFSLRGRRPCVGTGASEAERLARLNAPVERVVSVRETALRRW